MTHGTGTGAPGTPGGIATPPTFAGHLAGPLGAIFGKTPTAARGPLGTASDPLHVVTEGQSRESGESAEPGGGFIPGGGIIPELGPGGAGLPLTQPSSGILTELSGPQPAAGGAASAGSSASETSFFSQLEGMFSKMISSLSSTISSLVSGIGSALGGIGSAIGGGFSSFLGIFGLARGGDVAAGQPYIVGEERPEVFVPRTPGRIVPSLSQFVRSFPGVLQKREAGGSVSAGMAYLGGEREPEVFVPRGVQGSARAGGGGRGLTVHNHLHISTPDADSFRNSHAQIMSQMRAQMDLAYERNGGG